MLIRLRSFGVRVYSAVRNAGLLVVVGWSVSAQLRSATFTPGPLDFAAYATGSGCAAINLSGGAYTDSFDSSHGTYAQTKQLAGGNIGVTANASLSGGSIVNGWVAALNTTVGSCLNGAPGISLSGGAKTTAGYLKLMVAPSFPNPPPLTPGSQDQRVTKNTTLSPGNYRNIVVSGGAILTLSPGTYNINSISLSGGSILTFSPSGRVVISVAGNQVSTAINFSGGTIFNPSGIPLNLQFLYGGSLPIMLSGGSASYAVVYAPNSAASLSGGSGWYGAIVVRTLNDSGGTPLHYDRSLAALPTILAAVTPMPNSAGWNSANVTVSFTCSDPVYAITSCTAPIQIAAEGANQVETGTAVDAAGLTSSASVTVSLDKTAPGIGAAVTPPPNGAGWNNANVTVTFACSDALSGIASCTPPAIVTGDGAGQAVTGMAIDKAGNAATAIATINLDKTPPTITASITPAPNAAGWNNTNATVSFVCADATSGVSVCPAPVTVSAETAGQAVSGTAIDKAGNSASATATVKLDKTAPSLTIVSPANGATVSPPSTTISGTVSDALSGVASITCQGTPGTLTGANFSCTVPIVTGANSFTVQAVDSAGNATQSALSIQGGSPTIVSVSPNAGQQGQQSLSVTLAGQFTSWVQGTTTVSFGAGITVMSLTVGSSTSGTAVLKVDPATPTGPRAVRVTTGSEVETLTNGFAVTLGTPLLQSINPTSGQQGQQSLQAALTGLFTHFQQGISQVTFGGGITVASLTVNSPTGATVALNIDPGAATGTRTVTVTTGTEIDTLSNAFTVLPSAPISLSINPNTGQQGQQNLSVTLTGQSSHFLQGASQANFGAGIAVASLTVNSPTSATAILNVDPAATPGGRTVTLSTNGEVGTLINGFKVTAATPALLSVTPSNGQQGQQNLPVIVTGQFTHFLQGTTQASFGAGIMAVSLTVNSPTIATAILNIDPAAAAGPRAATLTTGTEVASLNNGFTVTATAPVLLSVTPNGGQQGAQNLAVTITGQFTHFVQGTSQANFGAGISVTSLTVNSPTSAAAILAIDYSAAAGARTVILTSGTETATLNNGFTVTAPPPKLLSITPNSGQQGAQSPAVTIVGQFTHFLQGTTQASLGAGITVTTLTVNSSTSATVLLNIDPSATPGTRALTVTTGTEIETLANAFTVTSPTISITATPSTWDFGTVPITTSAKQTIVITSIGSSPLTVNSISIAGAFFTLSGLPALPLVLTPSSTASFVVTYAPLGTISSNATVTISSNAVGPAASVSLSGKGAPPPSPAATGITVTTDLPVYHRAQPVQISGTLTSAGGAGIPNIPVSLQVSSNGTTRTLNPYTDAQGTYRTTFQPAAADGGTFSVTATATSGGATQTATASFRIFGLLVSPSSITQDQVMGSALPVALNLQNVGDAALNNVSYSATVTPSGPLTASFPQPIPTLGTGALVTIPVVLTAQAGNPPPAPETVQLTIVSTDSVSGVSDPEAATFTITLRPAVSTLSLTPSSLSVGVNPGGSLTRRFFVQNNGYVPTSNSVVTLQDPVTFNWVSLGNANLGNLAPGTSREFQVLINPPPTLALGDYTVLFNVSGGTNSLQGTVNISVTQSTLGGASFIVSDDTGAKVGGATVTLYGKTNGKMFQGVTGTDGQDTINGVDAGDYTYVVAAPLHDPATGSVTVTASSTAQVKVLLSYDVVNLSFMVTPTSIVDQYTVTLHITYSTTLPKPALKVVPPNFNFSFFPADLPNGRYACSLTITNTHSLAVVRNVTVDASQLDVGQPAGQAIHVQFANGAAVYPVGTLAAQATTTVPCYAMLDGNSVPTHAAGNIVVQGNYDFALDGNVVQGTTTTNVPVSYTQPTDLTFAPVSFVYDETNPANPVLNYLDGSFVHSVTSNRPVTLNLSQPTAAPFNGHNLVAFTATQGASTSADVINANQGNVFWHGDFSSLKQSLLGNGDTSTYDISALDNGLTLTQALNAQIAANPAQTLNLPSYLGFEGQWVDRTSPNGYLIPVNVITVTPDAVIIPKPQKPGLLKCLNPEDPGCQDPTPVLLPPDVTVDGQIQIEIVQKIRLERQAFNAMLGIGAQATLNNTVASIQIRDAAGNDASANFFVLVTSDPLGATHGGTVVGQSTVSWQLIPNAGAGGTAPQGTPYQVQATLSYVVNGTAKTTTTQVVTITVLPSPKLTVSYTAPFVVMDGKDAKIRVTVQNTGAGPAHNLSIQSAQPTIVAPPSVDPTIPNLAINFNITGSSNTEDSSGFLPGNLTIDFGDVAPGASVSGYWTLHVSRRGFLVGFTSTFTHQDYQGVTLDPLVLPPTTTLVPAIGGAVTNTAGQILPNLTVSLSQGMTPIGSDQTDATTGEYYIQDLAAGSYVEQVADASGNVLATQNIVVLSGQPTNFIDFGIPGISPKGAAILTLDSASLFQIYNGTPRLVTAATIPPGLAVNLTYNGSPTPPVTAGVYNVVATIADPNYQSSVTGRLNVSQATPVITWPTPTPIIYGTPLSASQLNASATVDPLALSPAAVKLSSAAAGISPLALASTGAVSPILRAQATSTNPAPTNVNNTPTLQPTNFVFASDRVNRTFNLFAFPSFSNGGCTGPFFLTGGVCELTFAGATQEAREPAWSKSGNIAYQFGTPGFRGINVIDANGNNSQVTPQYPSTSWYPCQDDRDPTWSPDSRYIAYACLEPSLASSSAVQAKTYNIWVHDNSPGGIDFRLVGSTVANTQLLSPAWAPDGNSIVFVSGGLGGKSQIVAVDVSGGVTNCRNTCNVYPLSFSNASVARPAWSPDGSQIAFTSTRGAAGGHDIYSMPVSCPEVWGITCPHAQQVTTGGNNTNPAWGSPDGRFITFVSSSGGKTQLNSVAANRWARSTSYQPGYQILDPNGNTEQVTLSGISGTSQPAWIPTNSQFVPGTIVVSDGMVAWTNMGPPTPKPLNSGSGNDDDPAWGPSPISGILGIDVSETAGNGANMPWQEIIQAGEQIVIVETWKGQNINKWATSQLSQARQVGSGRLATAAYILLSYGFPHSTSAPSNACIVPAPPAPPDSARWQVDQGLEMACSELANLSFIAIDVEGYAEEHLSANNAASRLTDVRDAIAEVKTFWTLNVVGIAVPPIYIYTRNHQPSGVPDFLDWTFLTGCSDKSLPNCGSLPQLWDADPDSGTPDLSNFARYGVWDSRIGKQYDLGTSGNGNTTALPVEVDLDVFEASGGPCNTCGAITLLGSGVSVQPTNGVTLTFASVNASGTTTASTSTTGPQPLAGYVTGTPTTFYILRTTAIFSGLVQVCINFSGMSFMNVANIGLYHYEGGAWVNITGALNLAASVICGATTSLSPFAIFEPFVAAPATGTFVYTPPAGTVLNAGNQTLSVTFTPIDAIDYSTATASVTLQVSPAPATVTLNAATLTQTFDGTPKAVTPTTSPPNLGTSVSYTLNGLPVSAPTSVGTYNVAVTITDPNYRGSATGTLTISGVGACVLAPPGLVSWWTGDGNTSDWFALNGASTSNALTFVPGEVGTGFAVGSGGYIDIPTSPSLANTQFTWSAWARPDGPGPNNDSFGSVIVGQDIDSSNSSVQLLWRATDNRFLFVFGNNATEVITSTDSFAPGQFYLVTGIYDGATFKLFVNGVLEGQLAESKTIAYSSLTWTIGSTDATLRGTLPRTWNGVIDEVQAFNRALSQAEIQAIYAAGTAGECKLPPPISSIAPNSGQQGQQNISVTITGLGNNWVQGTTAASLGAGVSVASLTVNSPTTATAVLNIDPAAATGARTVILTTGSEVDTLVNGFAVTAGTPVLLSVTPNAGQLGQSLPVSISGQFTNFVQGTSQVSFGAGITVGPVTVASSSSLAAQIMVAPNATIGPRTVTVTTGTDVASLANAFTVGLPPPTLISASPNTGQQGQKSLSVVLAGQFTNWVQGTTTASFGAGITVVLLTVSSPIGATALVNIDPAAATGTRTVALTTGTEIDTLANGFTVTPGAPVLLSANPGTGQQGQQNLSVVLTGQFTSWVQGTTTASFGAGITVVSLTIGSPMSASAVINIDPAAAAGTRTVTLTTGTEIDTSSNGFTVAPSPDLTVTKTHSGNFTQDQTNPPYSITVNNIGAGPTAGTVTVIDALPAGLTAAAIAGTGWTCTVTPLSCTRSDVLAAASSYPPITLTVNVAASAPALVTNTASVSGGGELNTANDAASDVTAINPGTPALLSANPAGGLQGQQNLSVALTGQFTNWVQGTTTANFGAGVTVVSLTVNSPTTATAVVNIDPLATIGTQTITLTTGSEVETLANGFAITSGTPVITLLSRKSALAGAQVTINVSGTALTTATFAFPASSSAIAVQVTSINPGGTLAALTVTVPAGTIGTFALVATNAVGNSGATVTPINRFTTVDPNSTADTDGDGFPDVIEATFGSDPLDPQSIPVISVATETESVAFSVLNAPVTAAGIVETESVAFSVLNAPVTGAGIRETESVAFSVLNAPAGTSGIREADAYFSVLNNAVGVAAPAATPLSQVSSLANASTKSELQPADGATSPIDPFVDSDGDGLPDWYELLIGTDPYNPDTDSDGLTDFQEIFIYHTDPLNPDSDGDGFTDGVEIQFGSDPLNPTSTPLNAHPRAQLGRPGSTAIAKIAKNNDSKNDSVKKGIAYVHPNPKKPKSRKAASLGGLSSSFVRGRASR